MNAHDLMDYCLLCLELNKLLYTIEKNSEEWRNLGVTTVLEKHFYALNIIDQPFTRLCFSCWQEVDSFHKFYLRIEEAHKNNTKIRNDELLLPKEEANQEMKDSSCTELEILIDQNKLEAVVDNEKFSLSVETVDIAEKIMINKDPLKNSVISKETNRKISKGINSSQIRKEIKQNNLKTKGINSSKSEENSEFSEKNETGESDSNGMTDTADEDDTSNCELDGSTIKHKSRQECDKFIAEHFKQMFCDLCDTPFENFSALRKHFLTSHSKQKGYLICCNRKFYQRNHLVDHIQCHFNPDHFKCDQCGKVLSDRKNLQNHMVRVHQSDDALLKHSCDVCGKAFRIAYDLRMHKLVHFPEKKNFPCTECGKLFKSSYILKKHIEIIHLKKREKVCYICGKTFGHTTPYKAHINKHAGVPAPVINCDVCGLRLVSKQNLKLHKESQHPLGGKRDHPCPICDKISSTAGALKKHINTIHKKGFNHKCSICEKAFRRSEALKEHIASHTGTPLYVCPWCPKTFNSNGNMHAHRKKKHPKENLELKLQRYN